MSSRNNQRVIWSDKDFVAKLEEIKLKRMIAERKIISLSQITKEIIDSVNFKKVEEELLKKL